MRLSFLFPLDLIARIREYSKRTGVSQSEMVRRAVVAYLEKH